MTTCRKFQDFVDGANVPKIPDAKINIIKPCSALHSMFKNEYVSKMSSQVIKQ